MQDWDIKPRGSICSKCQVAFTDNQPYFSMLQPGQEKFERHDYCETCWPEIKRGNLPYSMWRGIFKMPPQPPEEPLKKETAESLLRKLMEEGNPARKNAIFILAVMLERKKILAERDIRQNENGTWIRVYEHRKTGETFLITDPRLTLDELEMVQIEIITLLGGKPPAKNTTLSEPATDASTESENDVNKDNEDE